MKGDRKKKPLWDRGVDELNHMLGKMSNADIYHNTYLSRGTISKLRHPDFSKRTKKPQFLTMKGIAAAAGLEYRLVRRREGK